jgi:hypothetical protein
MRDAKDWVDEFCRKHIINSRDGNPVRELVEAVQRDALHDVVERVAKGLYKKDGFLLAIYSDVNESWAKDRENVRERYRQFAQSLMDL